jgi:hypothetical protein
MNPIWVGMFQVSGPRDNAMLEGDAGAWLWIAAQAEDAAKLATRVEFAMRNLGLIVVESKQLQEVVDDDLLSEEVWKLIPEARRNVESVVLGTWHRFKNYDA